MTEPLPSPPRRTRGQTARMYLRALARDPSAFLGVLFLLIVIVASVFSDLVSPHDPTRQLLQLRNKPPMTPSVVPGGFPHLLGTDELGRDMLSRLIYGGQVSIAVGLIGASVAALFGITVGILAGFYRGWVDTVLMRAVDTMTALPTLLIALFVLFVLGGGFWNLVLVLALVRWPIFARVSRGLSLSLRESTYIQASRVVGATDFRILTQHMLPNMASPLMVLFTLEVAVLILAEAALSFLGFGIQPPGSSWGLMIARGREYLSSAWWLVTMPGLAIFLTTLSLNLVAAWVRAVTDPVQRWRWLT